MPLKKRIDILLVDKGLCQSRERAKALIMSGRVLVNQQPCDKPGTRYPEDVAIALKGKDEAVSTIHILRKKLKQKEFMDQLHQMETLVDDFEFEGAQEILNDITNKLGILIKE